MSRIQNLPKRLQPMLATLTDTPFDDEGWIFEDKYDGFRMIAVTKSGKVTLYSRNGKIISHNYIEVARVLEEVEGDAVIDGARRARYERRLAFSALAKCASQQGKAAILRVRPYVP
jgi:ATP-dependent DNA ligase